MCSLAELPRAFTVVVRDRAGNTSHFAFTWDGTTLAPVDEEQRAVNASPALPLTVPALSMEGRGLRLVGTNVVLEHEGRTLRFSHAEAPLGSLALRSTLALAPETVLFGTEAGDLIRLDCPERAALCTARSLASFPQHSVTGIARLAKDRLLIGVLGEGLWELRGDRIERSKLKVGSAFVTGVLFDGRDVLVATAYNGLWRVVAEKAVKTQFPHAQVLGLTREGSRTQVLSGHGRFLQLGRDRYRALPRVAPPRGSAAMMAGVRFGGEVYVGGFDSGLWRWTASGLEPVALELSLRERQVNALAEFAGALWMGTEAGLLRLTRNGSGWSVERVAEGSVHDLAAGAEGLAIACGRGLLIANAQGKVSRIDLQSGVNAARFFAVAWQGNNLYAGGMEGLYRFHAGRGVQLGTAEGYHGGWVTALLAHEDRLLVGTYDRGVYSVTGKDAKALPGLEGQWVPLRALKSVGDEVWIGGFGMPAVRLAPDGAATAMHLPTRDLNDLVVLEGGVLLLTSDGIADMRPVPTAR